MYQELANSIKALMPSHARLCLPGLGSFERNYIPAVTDPVQGLVHPPGAKLSFNANLQTDDGLLTAYIGQDRQCSTAEAVQWLQQQVEKINAALEKKEIVELPKIGRLYRNFEHQLQFIPDGENFLTDTYGLQAVQASPVARATPSATTPTNAAAAATTPPVSETTTKPTSKAKVPMWVWILVGITAATLLIFALLQNRKPNTPDAATAPVVDSIPPERVNASPTRDSVPLPSEEEEAAIDTEEPTVVGNEHFALIAVGLFGEEKNAERLLKKLSNAGYEPVSQPEGKLIRVGVSVRYQTDIELQKALRAIKRRYDKSAFIMIIDGKTVNDR